MSHYLFEPKHIRTGNMQSDRSSDIHFDPEELPSLTQQQFRDECDINNIVNYHHDNGFFPRINPLPGQFSDLGDGLDFKAHHDYMAEALSAFNSLPAKLRDRFEHDPAKLLDFVSDPKNQDEAIELGLATRRPDKTVSVPDSTPAPTKQKNLPQIAPEPSED